MLFYVSAMFIGAVASYFDLVVKISIKFSSANYFILFLKLITIHSVHSVVMLTDLVHNNYFNKGTSNIT